MRVSLNWLKDYVDIELPVEELAQKLTSAGFDVNGWEYLGHGLDRVLTGRVVSLSPHPDSDHLLIAQIDLGSFGGLQLVTGAPNIAGGQIVVVALPGAEVANIGLIRAARLRGVASDGVVLSAWELGLEGHKQEEGILVLPPATPAGQPVAPLIGLDDTVLDIDITPNRADCLGLVNFAREVAAVTGGKLHLPELPELDQTTLAEPASSAVSVEIVDRDLCSRYVAVVIRGVKLGPSPDWMQHRLQAVGMRPINNVVDITNFVMLEMGQPLHAFDYDTLKRKRIVVRRAGPGERMRTLDGVDRVLTQDMLVIADAERATALAGIMGGEDTEINDNTQTVLLESANFSSANIRRTARALGLSSEASLRFERGIDVNVAPLAARRAAGLMAQLANGDVLQGSVDVGQSRQEPVTITLRLDRVNGLLGVEVPQNEAVHCLERLGLKVEEQSPAVFKVIVPTYRADLRLEEDLVEEIARLYGYDKVPVVFPPLITGKPKQEPKQLFVNRCRHALAYLGFQEIITYSFIGPRCFDNLRVPAEHPWRKVLSLKNPLGEEQSIMRTTLLPGLLQASSDNTSSASNRALRFFEIGKVFRVLDDGQLPAEEMRLAVLASGSELRGWLGGEPKPDFFYLKGVLVNLLDSWGLTGVSFIAGPDLPTLHPGRRARVLLGETELGWLAELHPAVQETYDLPERAYLFELDMDAVWSKVQAVVPAYKPWSKFQAVSRDIAVVLPENVSNAQVESRIISLGGELLNGLRLFDFYQGDQVPSGCKSLAYRMVFQSMEHTLTEKEINDVYDTIVKGLETELGAQLRR